ncbi:MAG: DivIVA domain-containing protein [Solirubrobacterales bacterium]|nr:DivIVA domain-containing protein [Solirubrobacterales bacterium]
MALERQSIERNDFPIGRRGYDPEAVDAHLSSLADEVEELKRSARRRTETLASAASDQVRSIVEAAETSASNIQRQAEEEAQEIRNEASSEARATREDATSQARDYVSKVNESTSGMLERIDAMESELGALIESLRTGSNRLNADLQLLEGNLGEVRDSVMPGGFEAEAAPTGEEELAAIEPEPGATVIAEPELGAGETVSEGLGEEPPGEATEVSFEEATAVTEAASDDTEGARLIALNMALNGTPREETERYLEENFELSDRSGLLDEVYASVEG